MKTMKEEKEGWERTEDRTGLLSYPKPVLGSPNGIIALPQNPYKQMNENVNNSNPLLICPFIHAIDGQSYF